MNNLMSVFIRIVENIMRYLLFILIVLSINLINSGCSSDKSNEQPKLLDIDTINVVSTISHIKDLPNDNGDTLLFNLLHRLAESNRFELLNQYLVEYYKNFPIERQNKGVLLYFKGVIEYNKAAYDSSDVIFDNAIENLQKSGPEWLLVTALIYSAENASAMGKFGKAILNRNEAIKLLDKSKANEKNKLVQIAELGDDYLRMGKFKTAKMLVDTAMNYFVSIKDSIQIANCASPLSFISLIEKKYDEALKFANLALDIRLKHGNSYEIAAGYNNIAIVYMSMGDYKKGLDYLLKTKAIYKEINYDIEMPKIYLNIGQCHQNLNNNNEALESFIKAYTLAGERKQMEDKKWALYMIASVYNDIRDYKNALLYYKKFSSLKDSMVNMEKEIAVENVAAKYQLEQKEQNLKLISKEKEIAQRKNRFYLLLALFAGFMSLSVAGFFIIRIRKNKQLIKSNEKIMSLEIEKLQQEISLNRQALDVYTKNLISKSQLIENLYQQINEYNDAENNALTANNILQLKNMKILTDEDWNDFKLYFEKGFPGFMTKLKQKHKDLSQAELRLILLIKLDLASNQTATMLGISVDSVKKARYRLKKKLEIEEATELNDYINSI